MAKTRALAGLLSALAALVGCDEGPASNLSFTATQDVWSFVVAAAKSGSMLVEVHGNPFRESSEMVSREMTQAIAAAFPEPWLTFTDAKPEGDRPDARLIWLLDPDSGFNADKVCAGRLPAFATARRVTEIRAVFCQGERPLSAVHGWMRRPDSAGDARWRALISQMARQLLRGQG